MPEDKKDSVKSFNDPGEKKVPQRITPEMLRLLEVGAMVITALAALLAVLL